MTTVIVNQISVIISLRLIAQDGSVIHEKDYQATEATTVPEIPTIGEVWNLVIDGNSYPARVTSRTVTGFFGGNGITTTISVEAQRT